MPGRDIADRGTLLVGLGNDAQLLRRAPATPPLTAGNDLDRAVHDLKPSLKVRSIQNAHQRQKAGSPDAYSEPRKGGKRLVTGPYDSGPVLL